MAVYDDDIIPPTMPPIITDPYDPFVNGDAARIRCPGTNQRTLFILRPSTIRCQAPINSTRSVIQIKEHSCNRKLMLWVVPENYNRVAQACSSNPQLSPVESVQTGYTKNVNPGCKKSEIFIFIGLGQRRCGNTMLRNRDYPIAGKIAAACILSNKRMMQDLRMRRFCNGPKLFKDQRITRIRRICGKFAPMTYVLFKLCHTYAKTTESYKLVYSGNLGRCRGKTDTVDFGSFVFARICGSFILNTANLPIQFGTAIPRANSMNCRTYEEYLRTYTMYRGWCGKPRYVDPATRTHKIYTCRYETKFAPQGFLMHRGRCGVIVRAFAPDLFFGRLWGGRDPFVVQARLSGRMMGKIRDQ